MTNVTEVKVGDLIRPWRGSLEVREVSDTRVSESGRMVYMRFTDPSASAGYTIRECVRVVR